MNSIGVAAAAGGRAADGDSAACGPIVASGATNFDGDRIGEESG